MPLKKRDIRSALISKFEFEEIEGSRHEAVAFICDGRKIATTRFSRGLGNKDIGNPLLKQMAKEVRVSTLNFFKGMIECTNSREDYIKRLIEDGYL